LIDKSLLRNEDSLDGEPRFTMLETIRKYGLEQLDVAGETDTMRRLHLVWFTNLAEEGQVGMHGPDGVCWTDRLAADHDNVRSALAWSLIDTDSGSLERGMVMAGALFPFWLFREHLQEGQHRYEQLLAADGVIHGNGTSMDQASDLCIELAGEIQTPTTKS
jgi:predicted ATPase